MSDHARAHALGSRQTHDRADVCVIGAGIAGLIAATRIAAGSTLRVVVIESGGATADDPAIAALDIVHAPAGDYQGTARARGIGGSSSKWAGKLLPLSTQDTQARPWIDLDPWPIDRAGLDRYTAEIEALMGVNASPYDHVDGNIIDPAVQLPARPGELCWRWPKRPTRANHRIEHVLRDALAGLRNLELWTDATVTDLHVVDNRLTTVTATNHYGGRLAVTADRFVIAAGTLETTRLLLLADAQNDGVISRVTDTLGRYFNDHFGIDVAILRMLDALSANRALADRAVHGVMRHLHGELSPGRQREARVGSAYFDLDARFAPGSMTSEARALATALRGRRPGAALRHFAALARDPASLAKAAKWRGWRGQQFWPAGTAIHVKIWIEQLPRHANRLALAERRDTLGSPMLDVRCGKGPIDDRTLRAMTASLQRCWSGSLAGMATLDWLVPDTAGPQIDAMTEQAHPAGSTRMGVDASRSVIDPSLRVHALHNVLVASASAFPSSGSANPTLTIMQLAMSAADTILNE